MTDIYETQIRPELPTELGPMLDYPSTPQPYSAVQDMQTVRLARWRSPWARVSAGLTAALVTVAAAAYLAGGATHARTVVEHAPPVTKMVTVPGPPDEAGYLKALGDSGFSAPDQKLAVAMAHWICSRVVARQPKR